MNSSRFVSMLKSVGWPSHSAIDPIELVGITCCRAGQGVSTIAGNVAASVAKPDTQILLVDCNFYHPSLHRAFDRNQTPGLADLMNSQQDPEQLIQETDVPNLRLLCAGDCDSQPSWNEESIQSIFRHALTEHDLVICDIPALGSQPHAESILAVMDRVIVVVDSKNTSSRQLGDYRRQMNQQGIPISGIVMNRVYSTP